MTGNPLIAKTDLETTPHSGIDDEDGDGCRCRRTVDRCSTENYLIATPKSRWTNEKHDAYLDSLERTFVGQLYGSLSADARVNKGCSRDIRGTGAGGISRDSNQVIQVKEGQTNPESIESRKDLADEGRDSGFLSSLQDIPKPNHATPLWRESNFPGNYLRLRTNVPHSTDAQLQMWSANFAEDSGQNF